MAQSLVLIPILAFSNLASSLKTCPGFPGYCSESFPGQTCNVVCDFGRNNVPLCQDDGTWTDIPRCIEHEPGVDEQIPGICPGIPGYCAQGFLNQRCKFDCVAGPDIDSLCTHDGTWSPYPVCEGDLRETRDGCDGCPGPLGSLRNRTAERILDNNIPNSGIGKPAQIDVGRKPVPTFAGATRFGLADSSQPAQPTAASQLPSFSRGQAQAQQFRPQQAPPQQQFQPQQPLQFQPQQQPQQFQSQQQPQQFQPQQQFQTQQQPQQFQPQQFQPQQQPQQFQPQQQPRQFQPQQQSQQFQPQQFQPQQVQPGSLGQPGSLFNQIKNRINQGNRERQQAQLQQPQGLPQQQQLTAQQLPVQPQVPLPTAPRVSPDQTFGPFESVDLNNAFQGAEPRRPVPVARSRIVNQGSSSPQGEGDFFGVFPSVELQ